MKYSSPRERIFAPFHVNLTFGGSEQSAQDPEQTGFAASVWPGELDEGSGRHSKVESPEKPAISTHAPELNEL